MDLDLSRFFCIIFILQSHQFIEYSFIFYKLSYLSFLVKNVVITTKKAGIKLHKKNNQSPNFEESKYGPAPKPILPPSMSMVRKPASSCFIRSLLPPIGGGTPQEPFSPMCCADGYDCTNAHSQTT